MKRLFWIAVLSVLPLCVWAQETTERLDSVVVSASRAGNYTPVAYENVGKEALSRTNPMYSLPMSLQLLPSVVTYNEGGTGLGAGAMTIRGSKGSQINVTLNGITLNDAESQEVFWANIPSLPALLSGVQVQRGLGTSASGAGAFGASINMNTAFVTPDPWGTASFSAGSYNTFISSFSGSTGLTDKGLYANLAFSLNTTDGYIRNAGVQSQSAFLALGWLSGRNSLRLTYLMGRQRSGITWDGISLEQYAQDRTYNGAGEYYDDKGNVYYYPNQTDNYAQHHVQLNDTFAFTPELAWSTTLNYTRGDGYDEYYKTNRKLKNYGFPSLPEEMPARSDMTYRKRMDNDLWLLNSDLRWRKPQLDVTGGVSLSTYRGSHWGELLWVKEVAGVQDYNPDLEALDWYANFGRKYDASAFVRAEYRPFTWLTAYADLQYRIIHYSLTGRDDDWWEMGARQEDELNYQQLWQFFNPRAGVTAAFGPHKLFASAAIGHREPGRGDIKENAKGDGAPLKPEAMLDLELGYHFGIDPFEASVGLYAMEYKDMLLETGRLSDSGYAIKENVPRAWRRGVELAAAWQPAPFFQADGNLTLSLNQIADYTAYVPLDDYSGQTHPVHYGRTTMLLSPSMVSMLRMSFVPWAHTRASVDWKYVGKQYLDNSMREELAIPAYYSFNLAVEASWKLGPGDFSLSFFVNNLFNHLYYASGWRWEAYNAESDTIYTGIGVYPQAPRNFTVKTTYSF